MNTVNDRLNALRKEMAKANIDAYLVPSQDPHQSEYVAEHWKARTWVSGFTGSAGIAVITQDYAGLWTDSRYFLQGEKELADSEFVLEKQTIPHTPQHLEWLEEKLSAGDTVGFDGQLFSVAQVEQLKRRLQPSGIQLSYEQDLIGNIWSHRPALPQDAVFEHDTKYAGKSRAQKIKEIRAKSGEVDYYLATGLDDIAWALNIRGSDVESNPVAISYLLIGNQGVYLFIDEQKLPAVLKEKFEKDGIEIHPYSALVPFLKQLSEGIVVGYSAHATSILQYESIPEEYWVKMANPIRPLKAIKNETEVAHIRQAMRKDGVALLRLYRWLEHQLQAGNEVTEYELAQQVAAFRKAQGKYHGESFAAIAGYRGNGAIVHYRPDENNSAVIRQEGILLLDSGGQYEDGTTDITRTTALSLPTAEQKRNYTLVLKGHIALSSAIFPKGTTGVQLDTLARMHLWQHGLNYGHGTGHGVGFFLNVHEPPQGFAPSVKGGRGTTPFEPGMLTSNEPGYYKTNEYGIRIENLELCVEKIDSEQGTYYGFESLTLFPISAELIDFALFTSEERQWLNDYHRKVFDELAVLLEEEEKAWLKDKCRAI
jgi:Xaa-Pro aminopeptidase